MLALLDFIMFMKTFSTGTVLDVKQHGLCPHGDCRPVVDLVLSSNNQSCRCKFTAVAVATKER